MSTSSDEALVLEVASGEGKPWGDRIGLDQGPGSQVELCPHPTSHTYSLDDLGQVIYCSRPHFPHLKNENANHTCFTVSR